MPLFCALLLLLFSLSAADVFDSDEEMDDLQQAMLANDCRQGMASCMGDAVSANQGELMSFYMEHREEIDAGINPVSKIIIGLSYPR